MKASGKLNASLVATMLIAYQAANLPGDATMSRAARDLVAIPGVADWRMWPWSGLRSTGFPIGTVLALAQPGAASAADTANQAEAALAAAVGRARQELTRRVDHLRRTDPGNPLAGRRGALVRAARSLKAGRIPAAGEDEPDLCAALAGLPALAADAHQARRDYHDSFTAATAATSAAIAGLLGDPRLREAIVWQNRHAYRTGVLQLLRTRDEAVRNSDRRQYEQLVARHIQRYAAKNDTIGFFGPVGWARLSSADLRLTARHGPALLRDRMVHFEQWAVDTLAETLGRQVGLLPWLRPRRLPFARLEGGTVHPMGGPAVILPAGQAAAMAACTGRRSAIDIATELVERGLARDVEDVYAGLADLRERGLIVWALEAPFTSDADRSLQAILSQVGDDRLREETLRVLGELQAAKRAVADAAGDPGELDRCMDSLESMFEQVTGRGATRSPGQTYAARTLVYEDCVRDVDVEIGSRLLAEIGQPLQLVLRSARWLASEAAARVRDGFARLYRDLATQADPSVPVSRLWLRLPEVFTFLRQGAFNMAQEDELQTELGRRWISALGLTDLDQRRVNLSYQDVAIRVEQAFPAVEPGWDLAHYHSPDIMLAAADQEAIARGDYQVVLGEVHLASNTLGAALFVDTHPDPSQLVRCAGIDLGRVRLLPVGPRNWRKITSRTRNALPVAEATYLLLSHEFVADRDDPALAGAGYVELAELVVERAGDALVVRTLDGRFKCDVVELFSSLLSQSVLNAARLFASAPHVPRISIDRVVLQREAWRFAAADIPAAGADEEQRYRQIRGWAVERGLPRMLFYTVPVEEKPIFVDLESPILVEIFAKTVRRAAREAGGQARVSLSEMLPSAEQLWLTDANGDHYTSELRVVAVDTFGTVLS